MGTYQQRMWGVIMLIDLILLAGLVWCIIEIRTINSVVERRGNIFNNSSKDDPT